MASRTIFVEHAAMDFRFGMAGDAVGGQGCKLAVQMAIDTGGFLVFPIEGKAGRSVVEIDHAVDTVMAVDTTVPKVVQMLRHIHSIFSAVTLKTSQVSCFKRIRRVAGFAG
jgi:hypothetical protein